MNFNQNGVSFSRSVERDLRLDLFRGIGLCMIFLDHIPHDVVAWLTLRNYGFSDAAEFFVFISGYLAGYIYGPIVSGGNLLAATKRLVMRAWQMYVAHILLFLVFTAQIARTARRFDNPLYKDELNVANFLQHPDVLIGQALTLRYKPVNLDVLPLYITLVLASPLILWCLTRRPNLTLLGSAVLYVAARWFDWNLASYPPGTTWYFNPFAWQMMFVFAAWCGVGGVAKLAFLIRSNVALIVAVAWIVFAFLIVMTWHVPLLESLVPKWMIKAIYPIDKTDLDMLRFTHFLALALVVARYPAAPLGAAQLQMAASADPVRPAFAPDLLLQRVPVVCGALDPDAVHQRRVGAIGRQRRRHPVDGCGCMASGSRREGPRAVCSDPRVRSRRGREGGGLGRPHAAATSLAG